MKPGIMQSPLLRAGAFFSLALALSVSPRANAATTDPARLKALGKAICQAGWDNAQAVAQSLGEIISVRKQTQGGARSLRSIRLNVEAQANQPGLGIVTIDVRAIGGQLRRTRTVAYTQVRDGQHPALLIDLGSTCKVMNARRISYDSAGRASRLDYLGNALKPTGRFELLNPAVPPGNNPHGVTVATIDSGINYTLPKIAARLARNKQGELIGRDFWDLDNRPFDIDTSRSPFFPLHHGTSVASVLIREAPNIRLVPYRYPRPNMTRMSALIDHAAKAGARIVAMPLGSNNRNEWAAFHAAAASHTSMLFVVSAGNNGRDIDQYPLYPPAFTLSNMIVVTSSDDFARLAQGSNWGVQNVDLMVPAERIKVIDHRGAKARASGSSYAVPRIAALAARLLEKHPQWTIAELIAAIRNRAGPTMARGKAKVKWGWIGDPADDSQ